MKRLATPLLAAAIFLLNIWLNAPLFMPGELPFRGSIEGGYVGMARFISVHPNPWGWNPFVYCGLPTQFLYVPLLPYLAALWIRLLPHAAPDTLYRIIVSLATCLGPVTAFLFALHFTRSRRWAFAVAIVYSLLSPSYGLFPAVEKDRGIVQLPWRIQLLAKYGEGPHNTGLTLLPLAWLAAWLAGTKHAYARVFAAAVLFAAIPLTNWIAALSLAISCLLLLLAAWGEPAFRTWRVLCATALAWLLACFWLTPSFVRTIAFNWPTDSFGYRLGQKQDWVLAAIAVGAVLIRLLFRWLRGPFYLCFITLGAFVFGSIVTGFYLYGVDAIPESRRYALEFELFLALALVEGCRLAWSSPNSTVRMCAAGVAGVMLLVGMPQLWAYTTQGWQAWKPSPPGGTVEYRLAEWIAQHPPEGRVFASGGLRFRLNSWFDLPQVGGGFETGLRNRVPVDLAYRVRTRESEDALLDLKALGAQYVVIHGPKSREYYRDFIRPERLAAALQPVYHLEDDTIYALPPHPLAHLVRSNELDSIPAYVAAIDDTTRPRLALGWSDASRLTITGPTLAGHVVSVQLNADPGWRATQDGRPLPISQDRLGFVVLEPAPAAATNIELRYRGTIEQRVMAGLSAIAWTAALVVLLRRRRERRPGLPTSRER